jgi:hypothetical protein
VLAQLEASGLSRSEAIRRALIEEANRQRRSSALAAEVAALELGPDDRAEMRTVAEVHLTLNVLVGLVVAARLRSLRRR